MILQALVKRYNDTGGLPFWQTRFVDYALNINLNGEIIGILPLEEQTEGKKVRRTFLLPEEPKGRTSGIKPAFLCDNAGYFFGADEKRGVKKFNEAKDLHNEILKEVNSESAQAIKSFFREMVKPENLVETGNYLFMVNGKYAVEDEEIKNAWNIYKNENKQGDVIRCLVTGERDHIAALHGKVRMTGLTMGGAALISINSDSFASYGKTAKDPAAQIGQKTSFAYVTALNSLLQSKKHSKKLANDTIVYWAEGNDEIETQVFNLFSDPQESDKSKLDAIMRQIASGKRVNIDNCDINKKFYVACLSPNISRISVRFFYSDSLENILLKISDHYKNLEIIGKSHFSYLPPWLILNETTIKKDNSNVMPLLSGQFYKSIISGHLYPLTLYNAMLIRLRAGESINKIKAATIKAILIRNFKSEVATVALNKESLNVPYNLGRLFSILEQLQEKAIGTTSIRQKYFSSACTNPRSIFPTLLSLSMHHADKLENATWFEIQKSDLIDRLEATDPFPSALSLQQQGEFIVGYYHQQQERYKKKEEK